jgi:hypothetical protein
MRFIVQVRIEPDDTTVDGNVVDVAVVDRDELSTATVGLAIAEAKAILAGVQDSIVTRSLRRRGAVRGHGRRPRVVPGCSGRGPRPVSRVAHHRPR